MISYHAIREPWISQVLSGTSGPQALAELRSAQFSRHLVLLRGLLDEVEKSAPGDGERGRLEHNYAALADLDAHHRQLVVDAVGYPYVGAWAMTCLMLLNQPGTEAHPLWPDLAHLGSIAVSVALAAGVPLEVTVPIRNGQVMIPRTGTVRLDDRPEARLATARVAGDGGLTVAGDDACVRVRPADGATDDWRPLHHLRACHDGLDLDVLLDDADPYRSCHEVAVAEPLSGADVAHWQAMTASTWHLLVARHRMRAEALAYGLRAITPLLSGRHDLAASTTTRSASWAIALTPPNRADRYACGLIHEFEHSTLNELQELVPLIRHGQGERFYSPWRNDPRPGVGLLHGVHAWISVTEFWRRELTRDPDNRGLAFDWARSRAQLRVGTASLAATGLLTDAGEGLLTAAHSVASADVDPNTPGRTLECAEDLVLDHALRWRLTNVRVPSEMVACLEEDWRAGRYPRDVPTMSSYLPTPEIVGDDPRLQLAETVITQSSDETQVDPGDPQWPLINGDYSLAESGFQQQILCGQDDIPSWTGLAVARIRRRAPGQRILHRAPELVRALWSVVREQHANRPSPTELATWFDHGRLT